MNRSIKKRGFGRGVVASGAVLGLLAFGVSGAVVQSVPTIPTAPQEVYALTTSDDLLVFNGNRPDGTERVIVRGLRENESLVGIDFRARSTASATGAISTP